ncbi:MAG: hypothetical protein KAQ68_11610 [Clostridiales bacterium]|nr:hypothetical protein [Clostridiales bacterium]
MKKRALIELTPLLDVILLILFAFIITMQSETDLQQAKVDDLTQEYEAYQEEYDTLEREQSELQTQITQLLQEKSSLEQEVIDTSQLLDDETVANDEEKQTLDTALEGFKQMTQLDNTRLSEILDSKSNPAKILNEMVDADDLVLEIYKYSFVMNRFYFLDVEITGANNRIIVNGTPTSIVIPPEDNLTTASQRTKSLKIYDELKKQLDNRSGGDEMILAILIVRDPEVYQYAYNITWEALRELELSASGYRFYKTSYTYID